MMQVEINDGSLLALLHFCELNEPFCVHGAEKE